ncbi:MAG: hypothetical protein V3T05_01730, partial [Myxococcota bacterium]
YAGKVLDRKAVDTWANELASYWYPSYNTDLVPPSDQWPDETTESEVRDTLAGAIFEEPTVVVLGKPQGSSIYNVFVVEGFTEVARRTAAGAIAPKGEGFPVEAVTEPLKTAIAAELRAHGSWDQWTSELEPLYARVRTALEKRNASLKALTGRDGFLFYRASLDQMVGGDLRAQPKGKDPFPVIVEFKDMLVEAGVDFLFVPVPTKAAVFPDKLERTDAGLAGTIVSPHERKLIQELSAAGVEVVDLLPLYLAERNKPAAEELYLAQDTHWTDRGLQLAAHLIGERIKSYPWYVDLAKNPTTFGTKKVTFTHQGDLPSRLADSEQARYKPLKLRGTQVLTPGGEPYVDVPESPITVLGDSFTGVYQRTFCRHAGLSAHIAKEISYPVDLVMSYGGGPNVRKKLLRRGKDALRNERLIIWVMAARDLYNYWEDWELLESK